MALQGAGPLEGAEGRRARPLTRLNQLGGREAPPGERGGASSGAGVCLPYETDATETEERALKIRDHVSYANVAATLALVVSLGTGGAYAASQIGSNDIKDEAIRSKHLKDRKAVKARDVKRNALTGNEINERKLDASQFAPLASDQAGVCNPAGAGFVECASTRIRLQAPGRLLVIATGDYFSEGGAAGLDCRIAIDGVNESGGSRPGEAAADNTALGATDGFARTRVTPRLGKGSHEVALRCSQPSGADGRLGSASVAALGVSG